MFAKVGKLVLFYCFQVRLEVAQALQHVPHRQSHGKDNQAKDPHPVVEILEEHACVNVSGRLGLSKM